MLCNLLTSSTLGLNFYHFEGVQRGKKSWLNLLFVPVHSFMTFSCVSPCWKTSTQTSIFPSYWYFFRGYCQILKVRCIKNVHFLFETPKCSSFEVNFLKKKMLCNNRREAFVVTITKRISCAIECPSSVQNNF